MPRLTPLRDPVTVTLDGSAVVAERGEPVAVSLVAAGHLALARSPKFHRPRGPACFRGGCDGCLARVDGAPNVMTCRVPAAEGMRVETQNVVGTRERDVLRMADWFFPDGMNHHELFAGVPGVQTMMQAFARRVAGLGKLPREGAAVRPAARRSVDVLVVGSGPGGMASALALVARGRQVEVLDDDLSWGGSLRALPGEAHAEWRSLLDAFGDAAGKGRLRLRLETTAAGIYGDDALIAGPAGVEVVTAETLVLAPGAHDGVLSFESNDAPGVMSARAVGRMLGLGVTPGDRLLVAVAAGGGPFAARPSRWPAGRRSSTACRSRARARGASGSGPSQPRAVRSREKADVLVVDAPRSPAYELCAQAGADLAHEPRGFVVRAPGWQDSRRRLRRRRGHRHRVHACSHGSRRGGHWRGRAMRA